jgi:hypothetical protein
MDNEKVGVGKLVGQKVKTNIAYSVYKGFVGWAVTAAIFGIASFFTQGVPPGFGGILLGIAVVLGICAVAAKGSLNKSIEKHQDVSARFNKGE